MRTCTVTFVGSLILVHADEPDEREIRRRVRRILDADIRGEGVFEVGPGTGFPGDPRTIHFALSR